ncbi:MAG: DUF1343 domain-containing protein [Cyclobacteriaceae bacterium]|nr:DUF1343 domain-containing protein [Cyclobacteriaceae bacterium]
MKTQQGLDQFVADKWDKKLSGSIGYLCHSASIGSDYTHGIALLKKLFGSRLKKVFSPQHGLFADVQDNMKESEHFFHPHFQLPVYSLYSETRSPTPEMLEGIDYLVIDLQDVGTRVYTYIYTIALAMQACAEKNIEVVILDRPNPIGGEKIEGNILEPEFASFVGMFPIPMRHGLTIGEFAQLVKKYFDIDCRLTVIHLKNWKRSYYFDETGLPWVLPSPNLPSLETAIIYPGSVLFEATTISEGRGTVKSLETIGHPHIKPFEWVQRLLQKFEEYELKGFALRPLYFKPTFNKFAGEACGGFQVHVTDRSEFKPWSVGQVLMKELMGLLPNHFRWTNPPYEYEFKKLPIDIINGTNKLREWVEHNGTYLELLQMELEGRNEYLNKIDSILLYK